MLVGVYSCVKRFLSSPTNALAEASAIALGNSHSCTLLAGGGVKCWGYNDYGQLGTGDTSNRNSPVSVSVGSGEGWVRQGWSDVSSDVSLG